MALGITRDRRWLKWQELNARLHLRRQVPDPELRARLTPDYEIFCKRIILSSRWYPALQAPNVDLVSSGIREVREHSIVDGDGVEHEIDTLILATGFKPAELPIAERIRGRDGSSLAEVWDGSPRGLPRHDRRGLPEPPVPLRAQPEPGPQLDRLHARVADRVRARRARHDATHGAAEFEVQPEVQAAYNEELQERLADSVWNTGGCSSWYFDRNGRNSIMWPGFTFEYRRRTKRFDAEPPTGWRRPPPRRPSGASAARRRARRRPAPQRRRASPPGPRAARARPSRPSSRARVGGLGHVRHLHVGQPQRPAARRTRRCRRRARAHLEREVRAARHGDPLRPASRTAPRRSRARPRGRPCAARGARLALSSLPIDPAGRPKLIGTKVQRHGSRTSSTPPEPATRPPSPGSSSPTAASCTRTATGCSARSTTPRTRSRRCRCARGAAWPGSRDAARSSRGSTRSPPTPA